jgi:hypothetical protein
LTIEEEEEALDIGAPTAWRKGDHILENYGQANIVYMLYHGFVPEDNFYNCIWVPLKIVRITDDDFHWKYEIMQTDVPIEKWEFIEQYLSLVLPYMLRASCIVSF